jgi:hypothetical protein
VFVDNFVPLIPFKYKYSKINTNIYVKISIIANGFQEEYTFNRLSSLAEGGVSRLLLKVFTKLK